MRFDGARDTLNLAYADKSDASREVVARLLATSGVDTAEYVGLVAASAMADYVSSRYSDALIVARRAVALARRVDDAQSHLLAATALALAVANVPLEARGTEGDEFDAAFSQRVALEGMEPSARVAASAFLVEAAFAHGRIADAAILLEERADVEAYAAHSAFMIALQAVRVDIFSGQIARSRGRCEELLCLAEAESLPVVVSLAHGFLSLIVAYQGDESLAVAQAAAAASFSAKPATMIEGGAHTVAGFAMAALGRHAHARELILSGGGGPDLHVSQLVDRAIGYDILVAAALDDGDLAAATAWARRAAPLTTTIAAAHVVEQMTSRIALAMGDTDVSAGAAERASAGARAIGRHLEATAAELSHARALIAAGAGARAVGRLLAVASDAESQGTLALRERAAAELRRLGRRVLPLRGAGTGALSARELEVAGLAAEGFSNRAIGQALFLSERTVQAHLRRAMTALGVAQRAALPGVLGVGIPSDRGQPIALTPRQVEVSRLVHAGLSNAEVAAQLGVSVKTVEKHVAAIFERWNVTSRTGISRVVAGLADDA